MSEYLLSVVGAVFLAAIVNAIVPEGKTAGMVNSATKLLCILVILTPFAKIIKKDGASMENYFSQSVINVDESFIQYCSEKTISTAQTQIKKEILHEFEVQASVRIEWEYVAVESGSSATQNQIKIDCIYVDTTSENQAQIQEYLTRRYGCKVVMQGWT